MSVTLRNSIIICVVVSVHLVMIYLLTFGLKPVSVPPQLITVTLHTSLLPSSASSQEVLAPAAAVMDEPAPAPPVKQGVVKPPKQAPEQELTQKKVVAPQPALPDAPVIPLTDSSPQTKSQTNQTNQTSSTDQQTGAQSSGASSGRGTSESTGSSQGQIGGPAVTAPSHHAGYLNNAQPDYPPMSRRLEEEGKVLLRTLVSSKGSALKVEIKRSSGHKRLDQAALNAVKRWRFIPAQERGVPVDMWYDVPIQFSLKNSS